MKQTVVLALALTLSAGVNADVLSQRDVLVRRALIERGLFGGDSTTNVKGGNAGAGGASKGGNGAQGGHTSGHRVGPQKNKGANGGQFGTVKTQMQGAQTGMVAGSASGGAISGTIVDNAGSFGQFGFGMFDKPLPAGLTINSNSGMSNIGSGGNAGVSGTNNNRNGGFGDGNGSGGTQGGSQSASGSQSADGGSGGSSRGGSGGGSYVGGGNRSKGGDGRLDFSPTVSVPVAKRALQRRALELEEEYTWIVQQKRALDVLEDPEVDMFHARDAEFTEEESFAGLTARGLLASYLEMIESEY